MGKIKHTRIISRQLEQIDIQRDGEKYLREKVFPKLDECPASKKSFLQLHSSKTPTGQLHYYTVVAFTDSFNFLTLGYNELLRSHDPICKELTQTLIKTLINFAVDESHENEVAMVRSIKNRQRIYSKQTWRKFFIKEVTNHDTPRILSILDSIVSNYHKLVEQYVLKTILLRVGDPFAAQALYSDIQDAIDAYPENDLEVSQEALVNLRQYLCPEEIQSAYELAAKSHRYLLAKAPQHKQYHNDKECVFRFWYKPGEKSDLSQLIARITEYPPTTETARVFQRFYCNFVKRGLQPSTHPFRPASPIPFAFKEALLVTDRYLLGQSILKKRKDTLQSLCRLKDYFKPEVIIEQLGVPQVNFKETTPRSEEETEAESLSNEMLLQALSFAKMDYNPELALRISKVEPSKEVASVSETLQNPDLAKSASNQ